MHYIQIAVSTRPLLGKNCFILLVRCYFHMTDCLSITVHAFASLVLMSFSVDETLIPWYVNLSTSFRELPFNVEMLPLWLKHMYSILSALIWRPMPSAARSRLCNRDSVWVGVFARSAFVGIVRVRNCLCEVSSASLLCQLETFFFH